MFKITTNGKLTTLYSFKGGNDGLGPVGLVKGWDGTLYGTTFLGGTGGQGVLYSITTAGVQTVLHSFQGGLTGDGRYPNPNMIKVGSTIYGTTEEGGSSDANGQGYGTVFSLTEAGAYKVLYAFTGGADGTAPNALAHVGGTIYGVAGGGGGPTFGGTAFKITPAGVFTTVHTFTGNDSGGPAEPGSLINANGVLYGTSATGGTANAGTVFTMTKKGAVTILHSFAATAGDVASPLLAPLLFLNGTLYGTAPYGGAVGAGGVFAVSGF